MWSRRPRMRRMEATRHATTVESGLTAPTTTGSFCAMFAVAWVPATFGVASPLWTAFPKEM